MNIQIDAKGKQCPLPVIEAKNAISGMTEAGIVEVTVDNEIAVQNLTKMADHKGLKAKSEKKSDQEYTVWMEVTEEFVKNNIKDGNVSSTPVHWGKLYSGHPKEKNSRCARCRPHGRGG